MLSLLCWFAPLAAQTAQVRSARTLFMPTAADSNSPAFWRDGQLHLFNSSGMPLLSTSVDQFSEPVTEPINLDRLDHLPLWIEAVLQDSDGTLYAWYHHEPGGICGSTPLTAPVIGALVSTDDGRTFTDLGIVLSSGDPVDCSARNGFFAGGHGDFSVIPDREHGYIYFLFTNYGGDLSSQGVAMARMAFADRREPAGNVWKYWEGEWVEPGLGGRVTPVIPAAVPWQQANTDSMWGPSVHWNTHLQSYVMLLNHACCAPKWPQEGIYISFNAELADPARWTPPAQLLSGKAIGFAPGYYPQVLGLGPEDTDTLASQVARLYIQGVSSWEIVFSR